MRIGLVAAWMLALAPVTPAMAQVVSPLDLTTDPADRAVMAEATAAIGAAGPDTGLAKLDAVLAKLPRPTPLRGMVQTVRASVLASQDKTGPSVTAVEEALRLLPDDPRPKMVATAIYTFTGSPGRAADLWLQASRESPEIARTVDRYLIMALVGRLNEIGDEVRADRIGARLGDIGFSAGLAPERSEAAMARLRAALRDGRTSDAIDAVSAVGDANDLLGLYVDNRFRVLWSRIADWAGPDLAAQSRRYITELRADWTAADDFETATPYARRLASNQAYDVVVALFLPKFTATAIDDTEGAPFLAPVVARSLLQLGRLPEALSLLAKVGAARTQDTPSMTLNIDGAYLTLAALNADWPQVVRRADTFLATARLRGGEVNLSAIADVQAWRTCALFRTGQADAAQQALAELLLAKSLAAASVMQVHLCRGDAGAARAHLLASFEDETARGWALRFVQPRAMETAVPYDRLVNPIREAVRTAPEVVAAANRFGRILPRPIDRGLPKDFDPYRARPPRVSAGPDAI